MKKLAAAFVVLSLAVLPAAVACDKEHSNAAQTAEFGKGPVKDVVLTGFLTDSNCGKANAREGGADCAKKCIKNGAKVQLVADNKTYTLEKVDKVEQHLGHEVKVTGQLDETAGIIRVASIEAVAKG
ncbi:MAG TPA: hypothetical protein VGS03_01450 [Candidatus Polarisedimenticolia bacterium]|jgi:hypothetical protein|nr:hypothetical protein [Candidatus Polarisedimenticolia bacterium]